MKTLLMGVVAAMTMGVSVSASAYINSFPEYYGHITCHKPVEGNPFNVLWSKQLTSWEEGDLLISLCESQGGFAADHRT